MSAANVAASARKAAVAFSEYEVAVPSERRAAIERRRLDFLAAAHWPVERSGGRAPLDARAELLEVRFAHDRLAWRQRHGRTGAVGPRHVLALFELEDLDRHGLWVVRTRVELEP
jgi:hypothetical protein